jgi:hypothetical protein
MEEVRRYRGHTIRFRVQRSTTTLYWRARGTIEYTEGGMFWTFIMTGAIDTFATEAAGQPWITKPQDTPFTGAIDLNNTYCLL